MKPSVKYQDRCLAFNASSSTDNSSALARTSCTENSLPFICETSSESPTCPGASICVKNVKHLMLCLFIYYGLLKLLNLQDSLLKADGTVKGLIDRNKINQVYKINLFL
jgi:hypothetical protein